LPAPLRILTYADALKLYSEAATLDPNNEQARPGAKKWLVQTVRPFRTQRPPARQIEVRKQEIRYRFMKKSAAHAQSMQ